MYGFVCCFSVESLASYSFLGYDWLVCLFVVVVVHRVIDSTHKIIWNLALQLGYLSFETKQQGRSEEVKKKKKKIFFNLLGFLLDLQLIEPVGLWVNILEGGLPNRHWVVLLGFLHDSPLNGVSVDLFSVELASCFQSCFQNQQPYTTTSYAAALQATQEL